MCLLRTYSAMDVEQLCGASGGRLWRVPLRMRLGNMQDRGLIWRESIKDGRMVYRLTHLGEHLLKNTASTWFDATTSAYLFSAALYLLCFGCFAASIFYSCRK
jgi:hypothetical protein